MQFPLPALLLLTRAEFALARQFVFGGGSCWVSG
jgi:hypothetical protein